MSRSFARETVCVFSEKPGFGDVSYFFECLDYPAAERKFNDFLRRSGHCLPKKSKHHNMPPSSSFTCGPEVWIYKVGNEDFTLEAGDAIYFDSAVQHSLPARRPTALRAGHRHTALRARKSEEAWRCSIANPGSL